MATKTKTLDPRLEPRKFTAESLELYTDEPLAAANAARAINAALRRAVLELDETIPKDPKNYHRAVSEAFHKHIDPVLDKHGDAGAWDTEPRGHVVDALNLAAKKIRTLSEGLPS